MGNARLIPLPPGSPYNNLIIDADNKILGPAELELLHTTVLIWLNTHRPVGHRQLGFPQGVRHLVTNGSLRAMILGPEVKNRHRKAGTAQNDFRRAAFHLNIDATAHRRAAESIGVTLKKSVKSFMARWKKLFSFR